MAELRNKYDDIKLFTDIDLGKRVPPFLEQYDKYMRAKGMTKKAKAK